jgi:hypothetical protein
MLEINITSFAYETGGVVVKRQERLFVSEFSKKGKSKNTRLHM